MMYSPGDAVLTKYGAGVIVRCFNANFSSIGSHHAANEYASNSDRSQTNDSTMNTVSLTSWAIIRLWRLPGRSIDSCAVATLRVDDGILRKIPVTPGMVVRATANCAKSGTDCQYHDIHTENHLDNENPVDGQTQSLFLIERYLSSQDMFLASDFQRTQDNHGDTTASSSSIDNWNETDTTSSSQYSLARSLAVISHDTNTSKSNHTNNRKTYRYLKPNQIDASSSSAKFYPILDDLMTRGEKAWNQSFPSTTLHDLPIISKTEAVVQKVKDSIDNAVVITTEQKQQLEHRQDDANAIDDPLPSTDTTTSAMTSLDASEQLSLPQVQEIKQIYEMLRDDDLTLLFQKGRERLEQLVEKEIPKKTKIALKAMGIEFDDDILTDQFHETNGTKSILLNGVDQLRKNALLSLEQLLNISKDQQTGDIVIRTNGKGSSNTTTTIQIHTQTKSFLQAQEQFSKMYDSLSDAAMSDPQLLQIFSSISEKTKTWQEMTGRILQTKTASLFMEGSLRLRSRAAQLLNISPTLFSGVGAGSGIPSEFFTRAFTEGDVAMAKLKSMEMGSAIRKRLFDAIELRSESSGGLDAIIAGSLMELSRQKDNCTSKARSILKNQGLGVQSAINSYSEVTVENTIQTIISKLQNSATTTLKGTKETLIALLSKRSGYRDAVLLRLEQVFMEFESHMGHSMSAEEISALARGDAGTFALFQPVAMRAAKEIEAQLDEAERKMKESDHWNSTVEDVMGKVRLIMRGELTMTDILDIAAGYLDDEEVVARSGGLIVKAETLLDEFEAVSARIGNDKNAVEGLRSTTSGIIDVVTKAGITKEGLMKGVEKIDVEKLLDNTQSAIKDEAARHQLVSSAADTALDFLLKILPSMSVPPFDGVREGLVYHLSNLSMAGFKVKKEDIFIEIAGIRAATHKNHFSEGVAHHSRAVKASELLIIDVKNISATLDDAVWSFEQTYLPYLKGRGKVNTKLWSGSIRLKFELRRRISETTSKQCIKWEPVLCLNDRTCSIGGIELVFQGEGRITWVANKLASWLKNPLRDYVVGVIISALTNNSGWLIDMLNKNLSTYWDFIMRTSGLNLQDLPKLTQNHVTKAETVGENELELVWRECVPLGLNILTNDESGCLKVIDLPRGTQAREVALSKQLDPDIFKGSTIVSVNGRRYGPESQVELFSALKDPARPKAILFRLASQDDIDRMEKLVNKKNTSASTANKNDKAVTNDDCIAVVTSCIINEGEVGIKFVSSPDGIGLIVREFLKFDEKFKTISLNDLLSHVNGVCVVGKSGEGRERALHLLENHGSKRPLTLGFVKPYLYNVVIEKSKNGAYGGPSELVLSECSSTTNSKVKVNKLVLKDFSLIEGAAESGKVFIGDNLVFINGIPVGAGCRLYSKGSPCPTLAFTTCLDICPSKYATKKTVKSYLTSSPLSLNIESACTFSIAADDYSQIGCSFALGYNGSDIIVKSINGVEGTFQKQMKASNLPLIGCVLESVDDEVVPSYINAQLIINALSRRWASNDSIKLTLCNQKQKVAVYKMCAIKCSDD